MQVFTYNTTTLSVTEKRCLVNLASLGNHLTVQGVIAINNMEVIHG